MSSKKNRILFPVEVNVWYKLLDNTDLYRVVFVAPGVYEVASYYNACTIFRGSMNACKKFITHSCQDHATFIQRMVNHYAE